MKKLRGGIITAMFLVSLAVVINPVNASVWHVYPGDSIQDAIDNASSEDTIYIHAGTYTENLTITKSLSLIGDGYSMTTIFGDGVSTTIDVSGATVNISRFKLQNGGYDGGIYYHDGASGRITNNYIETSVYSAIHNYLSSPIIENNVIREGGKNIFNEFSNPIISNNSISAGPYGIYNINSSPTITGNTISTTGYDCIYNESSSPIITGNTIGRIIVAVSRNGIYNVNSSPTITGNTIIDSHNGIYNLNSDPTITGNTITGNIEDGIHNESSSSPIITNNIITDNELHGIYNESSSPIIIHNTITENYVNGINNIQQSSPTITNNIVSSNDNYGIYADTGISAITYNDVWGNGMNYGGYALPGVGSISQDPRFVGGGNYHLSIFSPCIDAGTDAGVYTDIDGNTRPIGDGFDIGADEWVPPTFINPIPAFRSVVNWRLDELNNRLDKINEKLPEEIPEEIQNLLDEVQECINNANLTENSIYANNQLLKALKLLDEVEEKIEAI